MPGAVLSAHIYNLSPYTSYHRSIVLDLFPFKNEEEEAVAQGHTDAERLNQDWNPGTSQAVQILALPFLSAFRASKQRPGIVFQGRIVFHRYSSLKIFPEKAETWLLVFHSPEECAQDMHGEGSCRGSCLVLAPFLEVEQTGQKQAHFEDVLPIVKLLEENDTDPGGPTLTPCTALGN